jgi:hypothetical protein
LVIWKKRYRKAAILFPGDLVGGKPKHLPLELGILILGVSGYTTFVDTEDFGDLGG